MKKIMSFILILSCICILIGGNVLADQENPITDSEQKSNHHIVFYGEELTDYYKEQIISSVISGITMAPKSQICCDTMNKITKTVEDHFYFTPLPNWCSVTVYRCTFCTSCGAVWAQNQIDSYTHYHQ